MSDGPTLNKILEYLEKIPYKSIRMDFRYTDAGPFFTVDLCKELIHEIAKCIDRKALGQPPNALERLATEVVLKSLMHETGLIK